jgi:hypothetical protein
MYKSKDEIYKDYQIAIKFDIEGKGNKWMKKSHYQELYDRLTSEHRIKLDKILESIENYQTQYPLSTGFLVEIPEVTDNGQEIGTRFLILEHESGIETFIMIAAGAVLTDILRKFGEEIYKKSVEKSVDKFFGFLKLKWDGILPEYKIAFVEIRTEKKGVMRVRFEDFKVEQLKCLIDNFTKIEHLSQTNQTCFGGQLLDSLRCTPFLNSGM